MTPLEQQTLMRLYDGELPAEQAMFVARRLRQDAKWRAVWVGLEQVTDAVRALAEQRSGEADGIADSVMRRIQAEVPRRAALRPWHLVRINATGQPDPPRAATSPVARRGRGWRVSAGLVATAALAAAVSLLVRAVPDAARVPAQRFAVSAWPATIADRPVVRPGVGSERRALNELEPESQVKIEAVDFGSRGGSIFLVASGEKQTPVVWLTDHADPPKVRIGRL